MLPLRWLLCMLSFLSFVSWRMVVGIVPLRWLLPKYRRVLSSVSWPISIGMKPLIWLLCKPLEGWGANEASELTERAWWQTQGARGGDGGTTNGERGHGKERSVRA